MGRGEGQIEFEEIERFGLDAETEEAVERPLRWFRVTGTPDDWDGNLWRTWFISMVDLELDDKEKERFGKCEVIGDENESVEFTVQARSAADAVAYSKRIIAEKLEIHALEGMQASAV